MPTSEIADGTALTQSMLSPLECPARMFPSPESVLDLRVSAQDSFTSLRASCESFDPLGLSSRMFPDFSVQTEEETLRKSSAFSWSSAGMGFAGACSTRSFSESPSVAVACSLSEVLESRVPLRFFLSAKAARGILRRAEKRGRTLPTRLRQALRAISRTHGTQTISPQPSANPTGITGEAVREETDATTLSATPSKDSGLAVPTITKRRVATSFAQRCAVAAIRPKVTENPAGQTGARLSVRRLTPTECETLQGFPKVWTVPDTEHWATRSRSRLRSG